uniref:Uncharacterized protein n=1 Tax=Candidatus Methanogaster sp. ANME-2c ERB4 TaxID=2759911 RepID=A0A7G9YCJ4_9EURY|nr:hypothetical protein OEDCDHIP_00020 [Methanosarcinales archaeon ANME-2c ERB4]QNO42465.1 hypothetical protein LBOOMNCC_00018 [Methanosarcinales archaeon ANME-2c ERB4]QNO43003.1 hypothetical protein ABGNOHFO_00022 [Methanosarcinales archaeon ANME-2c ERB4]QNO43138.1 hypothetical protein LNNHMJAE_00013 [Methanosarcinales archaeon ANME-2c ERB4]QNO45728.1 hypothetical protein GCLFFNCO_00007 [Methanosarcinales archaeon ANME-2c ERB4]
MTYLIRAMRLEMIRLRDEKHKTLQEIADILHIGKTTVRKNLIAAEAYTPLRRKSPAWTEEEDARLIRIREEGLTGQELTAKFPERQHGSVLNHLHLLREQGRVR